MRAIVALSLALIVGACTPNAPATVTTTGSTATTPGQTASPPTTPGTASTAPSVAPSTCVAPAEPTLAQTEGPYYTANAPERTSLLEPGISGTVVVLGGSVLTRSCRPVAGAIVDFWQADASGAYDNSGFRLRGRQTTDAQGRYRLETVIPGEYPGRTPHIHVKVTAPGRPVLTTQLYLPDATRNTSDSIFSSRLVMTMDRSGTPVQARFDFVVDVP